MIRRLATAVIATAVIGLPIPVPAAAASGWPAAETYLAVPGCTGSDSACEALRQSWSATYTAATTGDYQAQRNVAYCLSDGCKGSVAVNRQLGCAWRLVIAESGHLTADDTDLANIRTYCGPGFVDQAGQALAKAQAVRMLEMLGRR